MPLSVTHYKDIIGEQACAALYDAASSLDGQHVEHINSTYYGGGVAEILNSLTLLMNDVGIKTGWRLLKGYPDFFTVTKDFHNALQGADMYLGETKQRIYMENNEENSVIMHIEQSDFVIVHDPQPLPLINFYEKNQPWIWRLHIDATNPNPGVWKYLRPMINKYDHMIVSMEQYKKDDITIPSSIIAPSINPLSTKNKFIPDSEVTHYLKKFNIELDKPLICQVSRFDKWKDPVGVVEAFKIIKKEVDCRLVLLGAPATDDPEGQEILQDLLSKTQEVEDLMVINHADDYLVNCLQRACQVVIQKSTKEGFGLTVTEALWKSTPVVAGNVGGIPLQVLDGKNGYLVNNPQECADRVLKLLKDKKLRDQFGKAGYEHVKNNFLITRHLMDYIELLKKVDKK